MAATSRDGIQDMTRTSSKGAPEKRNGVDDGSAPFRASPPVRGVLRALVVASLVTALLMGLVVLIRLLAPGPDWRWLPVSVFFIALESVYTSRWLAHPHRRQLNRGAYRLAELVVISLALRLLTWSLQGGIPGWPTWRSYLLSPLSFLDGLYFGYLVCGLLAWERAHTFSSHLQALAVSHAEAQFYALSHEEQNLRSADKPIDRQRPTIFRSLVASWIGGGMLLACAAALSTVDIAAVDIETGVRSLTRLGLQPSMLLALLVYFLLGLWLLSEARLEMMRARWLSDNVRSMDNLVSNWRRASLILLGVVALFAAFLPIGSTFAASILLQTLFSIILLLSQLLFLLITTVFVGLLSFLGFGTPSGDQQPLQQMAPPTPPPALDVPLGEGAALVVGSVFWLVAGAAAIIALAYFLRDRGFSPHYAPLIRLLEQIRLWLSNLRRGARRRTSSVRQALRRRLRTLIPSTSDTSVPWRFFRINALPPRDQIRYFYLSTVRRARDEGVPRQKSQTPAEYAGDLRHQWPEAGEEIDALTHSFVEARYSKRTFHAEDIGPIKKIWKQVRQQIRRRLGD